MRVLFPIEIDGWEYEDKLPKDLTDEQYNRMFPMSKVEGVRIFPYILVKGSRFYLGRVLIKDKGE